MAFLPFKGSLDEFYCAVESVRQNLNRAAAESYLSPSHPCTGDTPSIAAWRTSRTLRATLLLPTFMELASERCMYRYS
jgi:hypothetical protein